MAVLMGVTMVKNTASLEASGESGIEISMVEDDSAIFFTANHKPLHYIKLTSYKVIFLRISRVVYRFQFYWRYCKYEYAQTNKTHAA